MKNYFCSEQLLHEIGKIGLWGHRRSHNAPTQLCLLSLMTREASQITRKARSTGEVDLLFISFSFSFMILPCWSFERFAHLQTFIDTILTKIKMILHDLFFFCARTEIIQSRNQCHDGSIARSVINRRIISDSSHYQNEEEKKMGRDEMGSLLTIFGVFSSMKMKTSRKL